ncbi:hypothetical protein [Embleya sp. NBC_00896]|uniref:hypothetical protein n=1 Tax=Embleya sp. NBC_00896 TaxID=2975961 RepID=UPI00386431E5|nr:hypothetical protein OG928_14295 [Embleya sp. NBC_00896]
MSSRIPIPSAGKPSGSLTVDIGLFVKEAGAVADRLRHLSESRLKAPLTARQETSPTRAGAALELAQCLADLAAAVEGEPRREVPDLGVFVVGDQVAVTSRDLAVAVAPHREEQALILQDGEVGTVGEVVRTAREIVRELAAAI